MAGSRVAGEYMDKREKIIELSALGISRADIVKRLGFTSETDTRYVKDVRYTCKSEIAKRASELGKEKPHMGMDNDELDGLLAEYKAQAKQKPAEAKPAEAKPVEEKLPAKSRGALKLVTQVLIGECGREYTLQDDRVTCSHADRQYTDEEIETLMMELTEARVALENMRQAT